jgi:hypothetical protein
MTSMRIRPKYSVNNFLVILVCLYFPKGTESLYTGISESQDIYIHTHSLICEPNTMV